MRTFVRDIFNPLFVSLNNWSQAFYEKCGFVKKENEMASGPSYLFNPYAYPHTAGKICSWRPLQNTSPATPVIIPFVSLNPLDLDRMYISQLLI
jgi:hypothetical protein